jgi:hypothetical protein
MSARVKAALYNLYKQHAVPEKHYRNYSADELTLLLDELGVDTSTALNPPPLPETEQEPYPELILPDPVRAQDPNEMPSQRLNTQADDEVIRVDENGRRWIQEEVRKPAYPKPRGRRVLKYMETGTKVETVQNGEYVETFEIAGTEAGRPAEVKITLPSYQVGVYKDPRFPFKIHCYDGREGFDMFDVEEFYGGPEMIPASVKRVYIENVLCYDIRSVIRTISAEHRQLMLSGRIK